MSNAAVIAIDIIMNNSFLTIIHALSQKSLDSLRIKDKINLELLQNLDDNEKDELFAILHDMCKEKAK